MPIERFPIKLGRCKWEYIWSILVESLGADADPTDPVILMISKIIHTIQMTRKRLEVTLLFVDATIKFAEPEIECILWVLRRYRVWTVGREKADVNRLLRNLRKQLNASTKVPVA